MQTIQKKISTHCDFYMCFKLLQNSVTIEHQPANLSFMVCFMGSKETQEMELSSEMVISTIIIYTIKHKNSMDKL